MNLTDGTLTNSSTFTVNIVNTAPTFTASLANQTVQLCQSLNYTIPTTTDLNNNPIALTVLEATLNSMPVYASFTDSTNTTL